MTDETTPQDGEAMSPASAGSQPEAWAVEWNGDTKIDRSTVHYTEAAAKRAADECPTLDGICIPLYRQPQPALTDKEREALKWAAERAVQIADNEQTKAGRRYFDGHATALLGLLERLGG